MSIGWIKSVKDTKSFRIAQNLGMDVYKLEDLDKTDEALEEMVKNKYNPIIISNEVASFSQDIIKKYNKMDEINIIIAPNKKE